MTGLAIWLLDNWGQCNTKYTYASSPCLDKTLPSPFSSLVGGDIWKEGGQHEGVPLGMMKTNHSRLR